MNRDTQLNKRIPPGKLMKIYDTDLKNIATAKDPIEIMIDDSSITIPTRSRFSSFGAGSSTSFIQSTLASVFGAVLPEGSFISSAAQGIAGGMNAHLGFKVFTEAEELTVSVSCSIMAITDAWTEVVDPVRRLQNLVLPDKNSVGMLENFPGPNPLVVLKDYGIINESSVSGTFRDYAVKIGNLGFNHVVFTDVSPSFSTEVDQNGYPMSAKVTITFSTSYIATTNMINEELYMTNDNKEPIAGSGVAGGGFTGGGGRSW